MAKKNLPYDEKCYDREVETMPRPELENLQLERLFWQTGMRPTTATCTG